MKQILLFLLAVLVTTNIGCGNHSQKQPPAPRNQTSPPSAQSTTSRPAAISPHDGSEFKEVAGKLGVDFVYHNGQESGHCSILESIGGGVAVFDYDGDARLDLCFPGGGLITPELQAEPLPTGLFRNLGNGKFEAVEKLSSIDAANHYTHGAYSADYDNDGFPDVLITGFGGLHLWRNQGDGTFQEVHQQAGLTDKLWSTSAAWGDLNGDGNLDVYVCHYVNWTSENHPYCPGPTPDQREICSPRKFTALPDSVYYSSGDGTFREVTGEIGLTGAANDGKALGVLMCDLDADGDLDIYVANDTTENYLFLNDGTGRFHEVGQLHGAAVDDAGIPNGSMGVDAADYNLDGRMDLWVTNYEREAFGLYRNEGDGQFLHVSQGAGIAALGGLFVGFGTAALDVDHDSDEDLVVSNGHVIKFPTASPRRQVPLLLRNEDGRFRRVEFSAGTNYFSTEHEGRGLATGDLDGDGAVDLVVSHLNEPVAILLREMREPSHWLTVRLIGRASNRNAIGARLILHTSLGDRVRQIKGGGSYLSQSDLRVHWGLPQGATAQALTVYWPSGHVQRVEPVALDQQLDVIESSGTTKPPEESGGQG